MSYIIDGHNLIPKIAGLKLEDPDDEQKLISLLQEFCRLKPAHVEVYFDRAAPGQEGERRHGLVKAYFVRQGRSADAAIHSRLQRLGRTGVNWKVVSSDHAVQASARHVRAKVIPSETFAKELQDLLQKSKQETPHTGDGSLSSDEVQRWLRDFGAIPDEKDGDFNQ